MVQDSTKCAGEEKRPSGFADGESPLLHGYYNSTFATVGVLVCHLIFSFKTPLLGGRVAIIRLEDSNEKNISQQNQTA